LKGAVGDRYAACWLHHDAAPTGLKEQFKRATHFNAEVRQ